MLSPRFGGLIKSGEIAYVPAVLKLSSNFVVGKGNLKMKRIDTKCFGILHVAEGINEIMDFLETHGPVKNGKLFTCKNCLHATAYLGDLGKCCEEPLYEVSG